LEAWQDLVDVALTDLRYASPETAAAASDAPGYVQTARESLLWFWRNRGELECGPDGTARRGTICRLLVLPGRAGEAVENLEWLARNVGTRIHVSVMAQYTPVYRAAGLDGWNRRVAADEYARVTAAVERLGFENGWVQELDAPAAGDLLGCAMPAGPAAAECAAGPTGDR
jgi:putative pyruvate formate lyase activating enzyme